MARLGRSFPIRRLYFKSKIASGLSVSDTLNVLQISENIQWASGNLIATNFWNDDFNRADETVAGVGLTRGGNWSGPIIKNRDHVQLISNEVAPGSGTISATKQAYLTTQTFSYPDVQLMIDTRGSNGQWIACYVGIINPNSAGITYCYGADLNFLTAGDTVDLYEISATNGTITGTNRIASTAIGYQVSAGDVFRMVRSGSLTGTSTITLYVKRVSAGSSTWDQIAQYSAVFPAEYQSPGYVGFELTQTGGPTRVDNFSVAEAVTSGARTQNGRIDLSSDSQKFTATQGWISARVSLGVVPDATLRRVFDWQGTTARIIGYFWDNSGAPTLTISRTNDAGTTVSASTPISDATVGSEHTFTFAWTATGISVSSDGSNFATNTVSGTITDPSTVSFGNNAGNSLPLSGTILWTAAGNGTLTNADATTLFNFGDSAPLFEVSPGNQTFLWNGDASTTFYTRVGASAALADAIKETPNQFSTATIAIDETITGTPTGVSDTLDVSASASQSLVESPRGTDTLTVSETSSQTLIEAPRGIDTLTNSETASQTLIEVPLSVDTLTTSETASQTLVESPRSTDVLTSSETASQSLIESPRGTDTLTTSETASQTLVESPRATDTLTTSEASSQTILDATSETENNSETSSQSLLETAFGTETVTSSQTSSQTLLESAFGAESDTQSQMSSQTLLEATSEIETQSEAASQTTLESTSEVETTTETSSQSLIDQVIVVDTLTNSASSSENLIEKVSETENNSETSSQTLLESPRAIDTLTNQVNASQTLLESAFGVEVAQQTETSSQNLGEKIAETKDQSEAASQTLLESAFAVETINTSQVASQSLLEAPHAADTLNASESASQTTLEFVSESTSSSATSVQSLVEASITPETIDQSENAVQTLVEAWGELPLVSTAMSMQDIDELINAPGEDLQTSAISDQFISEQIVESTTSFGASDQVLVSAEVEPIDSVSVSTHSFTEIYVESVKNGCASDQTIKETFADSVDTSATTITNIDDAIRAFLSPVSDISTGTWHDTPLWEKIDEVIPDPVDYIESGNNPVDDTAVLALRPGDDPVTSDNHFINIQFYKVESVPGRVDLTVRLKEGSSVITEQVLADVDTNITTLKIPLTTGEIDSISDYGNLSFELVANEVP